MNYNTFPDKIEPVDVNEQILDAVMDNDMNVVLALITATKPDFYKQWSLIPAAEEKRIPLFVINTGQHFDQVLGYGLKEFGIDRKVAFNMNIRGDLLQKSYELISKAGWISRYLKKKYPNKKVIPIVHGDTLVAGMFPIGWAFGRNEFVAQNESGLRSMYPKVDYQKIVSTMDFGSFIDGQWNGHWDILRNEPFPEQVDTFIAGALSKFHFAPRPINKEHLLREGYPEKDIFVVGNSIVDALELKKKEPVSQSVFDVYSELEKHDDWIRVDFHRRGNLTGSRFAAMVGGVMDLVREGYNIVFIEMNATREALIKHDLRDKLISMAEKYDNFVFTGLWPQYAHVVEFLESGRCFAELTDSGSMQEELNELQKPLCLTARFNTDRPETVFNAHTNLLVPPITRDFVFGMVDYIYKSPEVRSKMKSGKKLYGRDVGRRIMTVFKKLIDDGLYTFDWAHEAIGFPHESDEFKFL